MKRMLKKCLGIAMLCIAGNLHAATVANTDGYDVGSPKGTFSVSGTGAAVYNISIDVPNGGPLVPEIGVCYNSQSGNGLAGYGFNITGLMCITRGHKDMFHDNYLAGVKYDEKDIFLLDGKRLLRKLGGGFVYTLEGDPYTTVTMHNSASSTNCWFTVVTNNGRTYEIGNSADSRLDFTDRKNVTHTAAWYVNKVSDIHGNEIEYLYSKSNLCVRPVEIKYGENTVKSRGITNHIFFSYNFLPNVYAIPFTVGDRQGKTDVCLSGIEVRANSGEVYRKYSFTYDKTSDGTARKFYRLTQVDLKNGDGKSVSPIKIKWNNLPELNVTGSDLGIKTKNSRRFLAVDFNKDGISDIVRLDDNSSDGRHGLHVYVSMSSRTNNVVSYKPERLLNVYSDVLWEDIKFEIGGFPTIDFDGDGYNDLVIPYYYGLNKSHEVQFKIIDGKEIVNGTNLMVKGSHVINKPMPFCDHIPLITFLDMNGDGRDDVLYLEDKGSGGVYNGKVLRYKGSSSSFAYDEIVLSLQIPKAPKKIFSGDYNNDGLADIIIFYDGGYKVYFNTGGSEHDKSSTARFMDFNSKEGKNLGDKFRIVQGDFNGDGLGDFAFFQGDWQYGLATGNGDGTFNVTEKAIKLSVTNQNTDRDDNRFSMLAYDFDHDGFCDFVITKANYVYHGGFRRKYYYKNTETVFVRSTGSGFEQYKDIVTGSEKDAEEGNIFLGDFYGDGDVQLANFGRDLMYDADKEEKVRAYRSGKRMAEIGNVMLFTDGFGNSTYVQYASGTDSSVYTAGQNHSYPVNNYTLPLPLVRKVRLNSSDDSFRQQDIEYQYADAKIHIGGKGFLGFAKVLSRNLTLGTSEETEVTKWDGKRWIPIETKTTSKVGGKTSTVVVSTSLEDFPNIGVFGIGNYFAYTSGQVITDFDGNKTETTTEYDTSKGVPVKETVRNDGADMYKQVVYSGYVQNSGMWMPSSVEKIQKHKDDSKPFSVKTSYTYDDKGHILSVTDNDGSSLPLTTTNTYDVYGNVLTSVTEGTGVGRNVKTNEYDRTGRFVVKATESATSAVNTFSYDVWGNLLAENDITNPQSPLTVKHEYDGWGREIKTTDPTGTTVTISTGWGSSNVKKYYVMKTPSNGAWEKTWYDICGREVLMETVGVGNISISRQTSYNSKGKLSKVVNNTGKLSISESFEYDAMGRVVSDVLSSGSKTTYSYGNRTVTTTTAGKNYTKTTDAWGNVVKSTDPISEVSYTYASCGKPSRISSNGSVTTIEYDDVANQTALNDTDAGRTTYTYAADGKILTETDARGIKTVNTYDAKGRLTVSKVGTTTIVNTYGTTGNEANRVVKSTNGNKSVEYAYDKYGRVTTEKRTVGGHGTYSFAYAYNDKNQLSQTTYPGGLNVTYQYDDYGFKVQTKAGDNVVYKLESEDGLSTRSSFMGGIFKTVHNRDSRGWETDIRLLRGDSSDEFFGEQYDIATGNMLSRQRGGFLPETFSYDALDRLVSVKQGTTETMRVEYANDGNIQFKTGVGNYSYESAIHPHAVTSVDNSDNIIPSSRLNTVFNDINKIQLIEETGKNMRMDFEYGPDCERWYSELLQNGKQIRATVYAGDYEKITENGTTREFYYLDGNVIVIKQNGAFKNYIAFTDNIGNILCVREENGAKVFDADYDAWGKQSIRQNSIGLHRGYTGHEMLPEFDIINMNGRLYDPVLGRFLSPDNYVQSPYNSQNFNRYSYCLNNPLKYNDPSGNLFWILPSIGWSKDGGFNLGISACVGISKGLSVQLGFNYSCKSKDFSIYAGISIALNSVCVNYSTQSGFSMGYTFGVSNYSGFPISTNFATLGVNHNFSNNSYGMNISAWQFDQNGNHSFNPSISVAIFPERTTNLIRGHGFRSNDAVLKSFVNAEKQQEALRYFGFSGDYAPDHEFYKEHGGPAFTDPKTGHIYYNYTAFESGFDFLYFTADHEMTHRKHVLSGMYTNKQMTNDLINLEEYNTYYHNYKNQGLYPRHGCDIVKRLQDYGYRIPTIADSFPNDLFPVKAWHVIYKIPRLW